MKLLYLASSPFARKVLVCAHEIGIAERIEVIVTETSPIASHATVNAHNPLGKVSALLRDRASPLYDSAVICEYLDSLHDGPKLFPERGDSRWQSLRLHAIADGLSDAAITVRREDRRPAGLRWADWRGAHLRKLAQTYDLLESEPDLYAGPVDIGQIALATALGWIAFRKVGPDFRATHPSPAAWYETFSRRPAMLASPPSDP